MKNYPSLETLFTPNWLRRFGPLKLVAGSLLDRVGLHYFTLYASLGGVMNGVLALALVVFKKDLGGSDLQIGIITTVSSASLLLGIFGSEMVEGRDKRPFILWVGLFSRLVLLGFLFCHQAWTFIAIITVFYLANGLLTPAPMALWQANISSISRNKLWGMTITITTIVTMGATFGAGILLDRFPRSCGWLFGGSGIVAALGVAILALAPLRGKYKLTKPLERFTFQRIAIQPVKSFIRILAEDRHFLSFEGAFMLYGLGLMVMMPVVPSYIVDVAHMNYQQAAIATGILAQLGSVFLTPLWGALMDRTGPQYLCAVIFAILVLYPAVMIAGPLFPAMGIGVVWAVHLSQLMLGIGMAGIQVAWSLAPLVFAGDRDSSNYAGAHVTLTGVRGMVGPLAGAVLLQYFGYTPVMVLSALLFLMGSLWMVALVRRFGFLALKANAIPVMEDS